MSMKIDSHHHFWEYDSESYAWIGDGMDVLKRNFLPDDLLQEVPRAGIDGVISVQATQTVDETRWLLGMAEQHEFIKGVVGWAPLASPDLGEVLASLESPLLKGIRHVVQAEPDDDFILGKEFNRGVALLDGVGLIYDILIFAKHLPQAIQFVDLHPEQTFVLDHIAKPTIAADAFDAEWAERIKELGERPHVYCKFSGVVTEVRDTEWSIDLIRPYWDVALEAFGPSRLLFGSDWPVCLLRSVYGEWVSAVSDLASELSADEQADFFGRNAALVYGLD